MIKSARNANVSFGRRFFRRFHRALAGQYSAARFYFVAAFTLLFVLASAFAVKAADGDVDNSFNPKVGGEVICAVMQPDGRRVIGGSFTSVGGVVRNYLARLNPDGSLEAGFNPVANNTVNCLAVQPDGKILVGGSFTTVSGTKRSRLARLNVDGTLDLTFDVGTGNTVICLALQTNGGIVIGGSFTIVTNGVIPTTRNRIARLNPDGTLDITFDPNASSTVNSLVVQADGGILCGGSFTTMSGIGRSRVARLDANGALDSFFNPNAGGTVTCLAAQADASILLGGSFTNVSGAAHFRIARILPDGSVDNAFSPHANSTVNCLAVQADGKILFSGNFTTVTNGAAGTARNRIARLMPDGSLDAAFNPNASNNVNSLTAQLDGKILLGGFFTSVGGMARTNLALLLNGSATNLLSLPDATQIRWARGGTAPEVSQVNFETVSNTVWAALGNPSRVGSASPDWQLTGLSLPAGGFIRARGRASCGLNNGSAGLVEQIQAFGVVPDLQMRLGGSPLTNIFSTADFGPVNYPFTPGNTLTFTLTNAGAANLLVGRMSISGPAALDFTINTNSLTNTVAPHGVTTFSVTFSPTTNGPRTATLFLTSNDGAKLPFVLALTGVGVLVDSSLSVTPSSIVYCAAVQPDGKRIAGGDFSFVGSVPRSGIARFNADGSLDTAFDPRPGSGNIIMSVAVQTDGKILLGGYLSSLQPNGTPNAIACSQLARINADGSLDAAFAPNVAGTVFCVAVQADGKILLGGNFNKVGGVTRNLIARLNADGTLDTAFDPNATGFPTPSVNCLAVQADGKILVGGQFFYLQPNGQPPTGISRNCIARLNPDGTADPTFDPNADNTINAVVAQPDGKVVIGGQFSSLRPNSAPTSTPRNKIARLNADGSLDAAFDPNATGFPTPSVNCLALQTDGKILLGGAFTSLQPGGATNATARSKIARLNGDGTIDFTFYPIADDTVRCLALQADGKILAGGWFYSLGSPIGSPLNSHLALLFNNPATNTLTTTGSTQLFWTRGGGTPEVSSVRFEIFSNFIWTSLGPPARVTSNSPSWQLTGLNLPANALLRARGRADDDVSIIETVNSSGALPDLRVLQPAGSFLTNGLSTVNFGSSIYPFDSSNTLIFTVTNAGAANLVIGGVSVSGTAAADFTVNTNGMSGTLAPGGVTGFTVTFIPTLAGLRNATLQFTSNDGTKSPFAIVLTGLGMLADPGFNPNPSGIGDVFSTVVQPDGKRIIAGNFNLVAGVGRNYIARLNADGTLDPTFDPQASDVVLTVAVQADGKILLGGWFQSLRPNGATVATNRNYLARLNPDGSLDGAFDPKPNDRVFNIALQADGRILLGGAFTTVAGATRNRIARLNTNGVLDGLFDPNANNYVTALAQQPDGKILLGGQFTSLQPNGAVTATLRNYIARLNGDGSLDAAFNPNANSYVNSAMLQPDGKILLGGYFSTLQPNGAPAPAGHNGIARVNTDGSLDASFNPSANDFVSSLALQADGKILLSGDFTVLTNGPTVAARNYVARLNGDGTLDSSFDPNLDNAAENVALEADGKILVGGLFTSLSGLSCNHLALLFNYPATNRLTAPNATQILWLRGGSAPEITQASFELSTNGGIMWAALGSPARLGTSANWTLTGLSLPSSGSIRARGRTSAGLSNAGSGLIEQITSFSFPSLAIRLTTSNSVLLSWPSPSTGYTLQSNAGLNLTNWSTVATTPADDGTNNMVPISPALGTRFFRLMAQPGNGN